MTKRTTPLSVYVDESFAEEVKEHAEREGVSVSTFIAETLERRIEQEAFERVSQETHAERRIEELVAEARDNLRVATTDHQQAQQEANRYLIALWELLKDDFSDLKRQQALETATQRLQGDTESPETADHENLLRDDVEIDSPEDDDEWHY